MARISTGLLAVLMVFGLAACGGDSGSGASAKTTAGKAPAAADKEPAAADKAPAAADKEPVADAATDASTTDAAGDAPAVAGAPDLAAGEASYGRFCFSCHAAGVAGAPKMGVAEDWAPRAAKGLDSLVASTIEGVPPGMPARGLCMNCSDDDLRNAVAWMLTQQ